MEWIVREMGFHPERNEDNGNRFLIGNGYMGVRGTLEEFSRDQLAAINLAGIYDRVGDGWREPLNAPNALYAVLQSDGETYHVMERMPIEHELHLRFREGIWYRKTRWETEKGSLTLCTERFADMEHPHFLYQRLKVTADYNCDVSVTTGIDGDVWDIYGPHYETIDFREEKGLLLAEATTHDREKTVWVGDRVWKSGGAEEVLAGARNLMRRVTCTLQAGGSLEIIKSVRIWTSKDISVLSMMHDEGKGTADKSSYGDEEISEAGSTINPEVYRQIRKKHIDHWETYWKQAEVIIEGDDEAMAALNYSLYHLHTIAPRHSRSLSVPARGLSGQTYKGAVFWDTELFMLPCYLYTEPEVAKTLIRYRIDTLPGALDKAKEYGYDGAFYAWESQEGGMDACSDYNVTDVFTGRPMRTYFRDKQIHISAAVVYGLISYAKISGDEAIWMEGGMETVLECARFYYSLLVKKVGGGFYELRDVIGPDEYHERVNNNGYTNRMAKYTLEAACMLLKHLDVLAAMNQEAVARIRNKYPVKELLDQFTRGAAGIYLPMPDKDGIIEQFDGYHKLEDVSLEAIRKRLLHEKEYWGGAYGIASETRIIKQADVVAWLTLFAEEYNTEILKKNWYYYEPRTEHGSSLSACMYARLACLCKMPDSAYPFFMQSAMADWKGEGKQWAGLVYIGGSHPAAAGGAYITAVYGFAGVSTEQGEIRANPGLPSHWQGMKFNVIYLGRTYRIEINKHADQDKVTVRPLN